VETPQRGYSSHAVPTVNPQAFIGAGLNDTNPLNRMEVLEMLKYYPNTKDSVDALYERSCFHLPRTSENRLLDLWFRNVKTCGSLFS